MGSKLNSCNCSGRDSLRIDFSDITNYNQLKVRIQEIHKIIYEKDKKGKFVFRQQNEEDDKFWENILLLNDEDLNVLGQHTIKPRYLDEVKQHAQDLYSLITDERTEDNINKSHTSDIEYNLLRGSIISACIFDPYGNPNGRYTYFKYLKRTILEEHVKIESEKTRHVGNNSNSFKVDEKKKFWQNFEILSNEDINLIENAFSLKYYKEMMLCAEALYELPYRERTEANAGISRGYRDRLSHVIKDASSVANCLHEGVTFKGEIIKDEINKADNVYPFNLIILSTKNTVKIKTYSIQTSTNRLTHKNSAKQVWDFEGTVTYKNNYLMWKRWDLTEVYESHFDTETGIITGSCKRKSDEGSHIDNFSLKPVHVHVNEIDDSYEGSRKATEDSVGIGSGSRSGLNYTTSTPNNKNGSIAGLSLSLSLSGAVGPAGVSDVKAGTGGSSARNYTMIK